MILSIEGLKALSHDDLAKHAQEGWDLAVKLREEVAHLKDQGKTACELFDHLKDAQSENADLQDKLTRLRGPFTCHHAPEYAGGACAACHATVIEALESIGRQCSGGTIKAIVDATLVAITPKK